MIEGTCSRNVPNAFQTTCGKDVDKPFKRNSINGSLCSIFLYFPMGKA